jgi:hypothetical protein
MIEKQSRDVQISPYGGDGNSRQERKVWALSARGGDDIRAQQRYGNKVRKVRLPARDIAPALAGSGALGRPFRLSFSFSSSVTWHPSSVKPLALRHHTQ